jgi:hypothetical protein
MKMVASLHGANGTVMDTLEGAIDNVAWLLQEAGRRWYQSLRNGCRIVVGPVCDDAS